MMLPIAFNKVAHAEVEDATRWYNECRHGLGNEFVAALDQLLDEIKSSPEMFPRDQGDYRVAPIGRFRYGLVYRIDVAQISVVAVYHLHREPREWSKK